MPTLKHLAPVVVAVLVQACGGSTPGPTGGTDGGVQFSSGAPDFDFSTCDSVDPLHYCPDMGVELCRLEIIRAKFAGGCTVDADCVKVDVDANCISYGMCEAKPAVHASAVTSFKQAAAAELSGYCGQVSCALGGSCAPLDSAAHCQQGSCVTRVK